MSETAENVKYREQRMKELSTVANWYPHKFDVTKTFTAYQEAYSHLNPNDVLTDVTEQIAGRILTIRASGSNLYFATVLSDGVTLQILANASNYADKETFKTEKKLLKRGDIVGIVGNPTRSKTGELSIMPTTVQLLAPCLHTIPKDFDGLENMAIRFNQRYLDFIINRDNREIIVKRNKIIKFIRNFLDEKDFLEVETPIISTKVGGANARPFTTHHHDSGKDMFMRISPELYLKQMVVGGFNKVYELGMQFRNESCDLTHQSSFTSVEIYEAFADYHNMLEMTEQIFSQLVMKLNGSYILKYTQVDNVANTSKEVEIDFTPPFKRLDFMVDFSARVISLSHKKF